ncbi:NfeD family protein, partial [Intestinibacter sp.]|uniref:NfeD family protein n=1 Tax=Intestinibacter sp. TaxID=1965304 RepID=UPI003F16672E
ESGVVKLNGEEWTAISKDELKIEKGKVVEIIEIEGVKLIVREVTSTNLNK